VAAPHADEVSVLRCGDGMSPDPDSLRAAMQSGSPDWVLVVHHEAMTGLLNPLDAIVRASAAQGAHVLVDAVGSFGVHPVDGGPDVVCFSSDKALGADPGLAGFFWRRELRPVYIDTVGGPDSRRRPSVGYPIARPPAGYALGAPPDVDPAALFSLERAVHPVLAYSRPVRCRRAAEQVWSAGSRHFRPLLPRASRSHLLTAFLLDGRDPAELARRAAALGQPILPGQAWLAGQVFRVPHVGSLTTDEAEELFSSLAR
jgi:aspartate aminotransferase-like enzyme